MEFEEAIELVLGHEGGYVKGNSYCVYVTTYTGKIEGFPYYYIGSTSIKKIEAGYCGSVKSKAWGWSYKMLKDDGMIRTQILTTTKTRKRALKLEYLLQLQFKAMTNPLFFNMSYANKNGFFGRNVRGSNNPMYGVSKTPWNKGVIGYKIHTEESKRKISALGRKCPESQKEILREMRTKNYTDGVHVWRGRIEIMKYLGHKSLFRAKKLITQGKIKAI